MDEVKKIPLLNIPYFVEQDDILPSLTLYGEDLVVVTYTRENRNLFNQNIVPVEIDDFSFIMVTQGYCTIHVDYIPYHLQENMCIVLRRKLLISKFSLSEDFEGYQLIIKQEFLRMSMGHNVLPTKEIFNRRVLLPVLKVDAPDFDRMMGYIHQLITGISLETHLYQRSLIQNIVCNISLEMWNITAKLPEKELGKGKTPTIQEKLTAKFIHMLHTSNEKKQDVAEYAQKLNVSAAYLTRTLRKVTGRTGSGWISEVLTNEIKIRLHYPGKSIQEIAEELNFSDQASLSKFFRKNAGMSPLEYRNGLFLKKRVK